MLPDQANDRSRDGNAGITWNMAFETATVKYELLAKVRYTHSTGDVSKMAWFLLRDKCGGL